MKSIFEIDSETWTPSAELHVICHPETDNINSVEWEGI